MKNLATFDQPSLDPAQQEIAATARFSVLSEKLTDSEAEQVRHTLPAGIRDLWEAPDED